MHEKKARMPMVRRNIHKLNSHRDCIAWPSELKLHFFVERLENQAAMVPEAFVKMFAERLATLMKDEFVMLLEVTGELQKLYNKTSLIMGVLGAAEKMAIDDPVLQQWVARLKDVMYDADDTIDEYQTKTLLVRPNLPLLCSCFAQLSVRHSIGKRIKSINHRLEDINKEREQFHLPSSSTSSITTSGGISRITSPLVESDIVGMKIIEDTRKLVHVLTKETQKHIQVLAIMGTGGIGKTTLAQNIYNDEEIKASFALKAWVCVSKEFTDIRVLRDILNSLNVDYHETYGRTHLEPKLESAIRDKKFLIILDDIWSAQVWTDLLRNPLQSGASGSRILVTTRNEGVAKGMKAAPIYPVELMSPEEGWELLCKKVELGGEEEEMENVKEIGKQIVEKCGGLPLAIKTVGGVLCMKDKNRKAWKEVLKSSAWSLSKLPEGVEGALYLSYEDLPSHLKQCFLYCSLFPEDSPIERNQVVECWISEGFVRAEGNTMPEVIGEGYFRELVQRSLLQPDPKYYDQGGCTMHDKLRSLALFLTQDEVFVMTDANEQRQDNSSKLRRLCAVVSKEKSKVVVDATRRDDSLRTLMLDGLAMDENDVNDLIKSKKHLRLLRLRHSRISRLPESLGILVQLRCLDLSGSDIIELPKSIRNLVNLQFLILSNCRELCNLPRAIGKLRNLRCLNLRHTELEAIPAEVGRLHNLNVLLGFVVNNGNRGHRQSRDSWCTLEELRSLTQLRALEIRKLERAWTEAAVRQGSILQNKANLEVLLLHCTSGEAGYGEVETKRIEEVFEVALCPSPSLQILDIDGFFGLHYPSWMVSNGSIGSHLQDLRWLALRNCIRFAQLPSHGKLPSLEILWITGALSVKTIGPEFLGYEADCDGGRVLFPKLRRLSLENMHNWETWQWEEEHGIRIFPLLTYLMLVDCPKLRHLPAFLGHHATCLRNLSVTNCGSLETLGGISNLSSLQFLGLEDDTMESLPQWFSGEQGQPQFLTLKKLEIVASEQLLRKCLPDGSDWPKIQHIQYVYACTPSKSKFISKTLSSFNTNLDDDEQDMKDDDDT